MTMSRAQIFDYMRDNGITRIGVSFSGGNDEGGADSMTAYLANGDPKELDDGLIAYKERGGARAESESWIVYEPDRAQGGSTKRPATEAEIALAELHEALEAPIYATYGGFDGEPTVHGVLTWDLATQTATMTGDESREVYEPFERDV